MNILKNNPVEIFENDSRLIGSKEGSSHDHRAVVRWRFNDDPYPFSVSPIRVTCKLRKGDLELVLVSTTGVAIVPSMTAT